MPDDPLRRFLGDSEIAIAESDSVKTHNLLRYLVENVQRTQQAIKGNVERTYQQVRLLIDAHPALAAVADLQRCQLEMSRVVETCEVRDAQIEYLLQLLGVNTSLDRPAAGPLVTIPAQLAGVKRKREAKQPADSKKKAIPTIPTEENSVSEAHVPTAQQSVQERDDTVKKSAKAKGTNVQKVNQVKKASDPSTGQDGPERVIDEVAEGRDHDMHDAQSPEISASKVPASPVAASLTSSAAEDLAAADQLQQGNKTNDPKSARSKDKVKKDQEAAKKEPTSRKTKVTKAPKIAQNIKNGRAKAQGEVNAETGAASDPAIATGKPRLQGRQGSATVELQAQPQDSKLPVSTPRDRTMITARSPPNASVKKTPAGKDNTDTADTNQQNSDMPVPKAAVDVLDNRTSSASKVPTTSSPEPAAETDGKVIATQTLTPSGKANEAKSPQAEANTNESDSVAMAMPIIDSFEPDSSPDKQELSVQTIDHEIPAGIASTPEEIKPISDEQPVQVPPRKIKAAKKSNPTEVVESSQPEFDQAASQARKDRLAKSVPASKESHIVPEESQLAAQPANAAKSSQPLPPTSQDGREGLATPAPVANSPILPSSQRAALLATPLSVMSPSTVMSPRMKAVRSAPLDKLQRARQRALESKRARRLSEKTLLTQM